MNPFLQSSKKLIQRNGVSAKYVLIGSTSYNVETEPIQLLKQNTILLHIQNKLLLINIIFLT